MARGEASTSRGRSLQSFMCFEKLGDQPLRLRYAKPEEVRDGANSNELVDGEKLARKPELRELGVRPPKLLYEVYGYILPSFGKAGLHQHTDSAENAPAKLFQGHGYCLDFRLQSLKCGIRKAWTAQLFTGTVGWDSSPAMATASVMYG